MAASETLNVGDSARWWLLLLSLPPNKGLYIKALSQSLLNASRAALSSNRKLILFIGFPYTESDSRTQAYNALQKQYAKLYQAVCRLTTRYAIDVENNNDVDVRIFAYNDPDLPTSGALDSPVPIGLATLHSIKLGNRRWDKIQATDDREEPSLMNRIRNVLQLSNNSDSIPVEKLPGDFEFSEHYEGRPPSTQQAHHSVAVGGTFDHFHIGHKLLLTMTYLRLEPFEGNISQADKISRKLVVGITSDELLREKKFRDEMQDWDTRAASVRDFIQSLQEIDGSTANDLSRSPDRSDLRDTFVNGLNIAYTEIHDPFGPTITDESLSALIVSGETRAGGKAINDRRQEKGWAPLEIYEVDVLDAADSNEEASSKVEDEFRSKVSSTEIRRRLHKRKQRTEAA